MEFKQLEAFVAVVEWNSFSEAAKHIYLTQPTISSHIRSLETELNTTLLNRTTKHMEVTEDGQYLYEEAQKLLKLRGRIYEKFSQNPVSTIRLGASTIPALYLLPNVLPVFEKSIRYTNLSCGSPTAWAFWTGCRNTTLILASWEQKLICRTIPLSPLPEMN